MKVLYLPRWYPNRYDPMPGLFIERHARSVAGLVDVAVLYVHQDDKIPKGTFEVNQTEDRELFQVKIHYSASRCFIPLLRPVINILKYVHYHRKGLKMILAGFGKPDLIHVNVLTRLGVLAMMYKWMTGTPYVITEHWTRYLPHMDNFKGTARKIAAKMVVRRAAAVMPVTDNLRKAMEKHGLVNDNYRIIPNVVDMNMFRLKSFKSQKEIKTFIHVSCFEDRQKNISGILRTLKRLSEQRNDWQCLMIGEGIHLDKLKEYSNSLGLDEKLVIFAGLKENDELAGMMADADFQVLFSRFENLPVVILESYACGVPVLSTDVGGINEHLDNKLGILIPSENEDQLYEKLNYLLDHYKDFDKEHIRNYAINNFSREVIGKQLFEVYSEVMIKPGRKPQAASHKP